MDNRPFIKWHCERLLEMLAPYKDNQPLLVLLKGEVRRYVNSPEAQRVQAQVPPGIKVEHE